MKDLNGQPDYADWSARRADSSGMDQWLIYSMLAGQNHHHHRHHYDDQPGGSGVGYGGGGYDGSGYGGGGFGGGGGYDGGGVGGGSGWVDGSGWGVTAVAVSSVTEAARPTVVFGVVVPVRGRWLLPVTVGRNSSCFPRLQIGICDLAGRHSG